MCVALQLWCAASARAQIALPATSSDQVLVPHLSFDRVTGMAKGGVSAITQDGAGFIWFGTEEGLSRYDGYEFVNYVPGKHEKNTLANFTVTSLAAGKDALWIGTVKGLERLDLTTYKF